MPHSRTGESPFKDDHHQLIGQGSSRRRFPYHVVPIKKGKQHVGYEIWCNDQKFLLPADTRHQLKRHEAYAVARLLNLVSRTKKWADRIGELYG